MRQSKPATHVCCPCYQKENRKWGTAVTATVCRDACNSSCSMCLHPPLSNSCHHSSNQFGTGKVDMAGQNVRCSSLLAMQSEGVQATVAELPPHNTICGTQSCISRMSCWSPILWHAKAVFPALCSGLQTQVPQKWSIHSPSARGSRVWIMSWKMVLRIWELCREAELLPRCKADVGYGKVQCSS